MAYEVSDVPQSVLTTNQWTLTIEGETYATFTSINGLTRTMQPLTRADGGTGITHKFPAPSIEYGRSVTLQRVVDPLDAKDATIGNFLTQSIEEGTKYSAELTKYFHGDVLFRIRMYGLLFTGETIPSMDKNTANAYQVSYACTVDYWEEVSAEA